MEIWVPFNEIDKMEEGKLVHPHQLLEQLVRQQTELIQGKILSFLPKMSSPCDTYNCPAQNTIKIDPMDDLSGPKGLYQPRNWRTPGNCPNYHHQPQGQALMILCSSLNP